MQSTRRSFLLAAASGGLGAAAAAFGNGNSSAEWTTTRRRQTHEFDSNGRRVVFRHLLAEAGVQTSCNLSAVESVCVGERMAAVPFAPKTAQGRAQKNLH